ncbi:IS4 family transposase, partial [Bradyrhizobium sp. 147]|nr:IS4 family transposase [Bradyrhizobium sp. 147]
WKLITDLPVGSRTDVIEKLEWYALRWKIEVFHKILKSGCKAEESKLRTAQRLTNLISLFCILSWRVFWMTMLNDKPKARKTLSHYLIKIARLGGYLARASDPPPGNTVVWRGLSRLTDIALGVTVGVEFVGN